MNTHISRRDDVNPDEGEDRHAVGGAVAGNERPGRGQPIAERLADARAGLERVEPADLPALQRAGAFVVDTRTAVTRTPEGHIPGAVVIDRLVLEWRLDPTSGAAMTDGPAYEDVVVVVCNEGYSSSLAARDLQRLGFSRATDLVGGFRGYVGAGQPVVAEPTRVVT